MIFHLFFFFSLFFFGFFFFNFFFFSKINVLLGIWREVFCCLVVLQNQDQKVYFGANRKFSCKDRRSVLWVSGDRRRCWFLLQQQQQQQQQQLWQHGGVLCCSDWGWLVFVGGESQWQLGCCVKDFSWVAWRICNFNGWKKSCFFFFFFFFCIQRREAFEGREKKIVK